MFSSKKMQIILGLLGLGLVVFLLQKEGFAHVGQSLRLAAAYVPIIIFFEFCFWIFGSLAQRELYGAEKQNIPWSEFWRAGCSAYAIMAFVPMGRVVAEVARAYVFAPYVGKQKAAAVAIQVQILAVSVTALIAIGAALGFYLAVGPAFSTFIAAVHAVLISLVASLGILASKRFNIGKRLKFLLPRVEVFGEEFEAYFISESAFPKRAIFFEFLARLSQVAQNGILVLAVGGVFGLVPAFCSEGLHLIGATLGDLVPGQWGVTELVYSEAGSVLKITAEDALSIALLAHVAQLFWVVLALLLPVFVFKPSDRNTSLKSLG